MGEKIKNVSFEELVVQKKKLDDATKKVKETKKSFDSGNYLETQINKMNDALLYFLTLGRIYYGFPSLSQEDMEKRFEADLKNFDNQKEIQRTGHCVEAIRRMEEKIAYKEEADQISYTDDSLNSPKIPKLDLTAKHKNI